MIEQILSLREKNANLEKKSADSRYDREAWTAALKKQESRYEPMRQEAELVASCAAAPGSSNRRASGQRPVTGSFRNPGATSTVFVSHFPPHDDFLQFPADRKKLQKFPFRVF